MADLAKEKGGSVGCQRGAAEGVRSPRPILARGRRQVISKSQVYLVSLRRARPQPEAQLGQVKAQKMFRFSCGLGQLLLAHGEQPVRILNPSSHNHTRARLQGEGRRAPSMAARFRGGRRGQGDGARPLVPRSWPPVPDAVHRGGNSLRPVAPEDGRAAPRGGHDRDVQEHEGWGRDLPRGHGFRAPGSGARGRGAHGQFPAQPQGGLMAGVRSGQWREHRGR